jgi:hypothetical protein
MPESLYAGPNAMSLARVSDSQARTARANLSRIPHLATRMPRASKTYPHGELHLPVAEPRSAPVFIEAESFEILLALNSPQGSCLI